MMDEAKALRCPSCHGTTFVEGQLPATGYIGARVRFKPTANWVKAHDMAATACLGCGLVLLRLTPSDLKALRGDGGA